MFLDCNELSGEIPLELGNLSNLQEVRLGGSNQFVGCIPDWFRYVIGGYSELPLPFCETVPELTFGSRPIPIGDAPLPVEWDGTPGREETESMANLTPIGVNGLTGTLHLIQVERQTKVTITLDNAGPGPYAASIRRGGCPDDGEEPSGLFDYLLFDVKDGESVSMVNTPPQFFQFSLAYVIVVDGRASPTDPPVACGNIPSSLR